MGEGNKQVRVDNWGTFFLQRLQVFFAKTDYCDLTLQFDGNVQLKVHRLVVHACTEYFRFLEETCPAVEENTILMPSDLQSDVIVPIVNFMYTGMLEFHVSLYDKLYKASELMKISILTKLLEAQKISPSSKSTKSKPEKRQPPSKLEQSPLELPNPLPVKKMQVWKRKSVPISSTPLATSHMSSSSMSFDQKWHTSDHLSLDNTPKPTRFEWPEDDLPTMTLLDTSFEDISYTSKPLLTKEEEEKVKPNFDDLRNNVELPIKKATSKTSSNTVNFKEMEEFSKEQKIRSAMFDDYDELNEVNQKRKAEPTTFKGPAKKIKISNKENKETTISVESTTPGEIDHTKIVTEILKKYPELVKKNKNIKLKIMPGNKDSGEKKFVNAIVEQVKRQNPEPIEKPKQPAKVAPTKRKNKIEELDEEGPWVCKKCIMMEGEVQEFVLYYLYRKHMTDVHDEVFDSRLCKYCGRKCNNHNLMMYHMYTKHALKPPQSYNFPKCDRCPYIALSEFRLNKHKLLHNSNEMQCNECKLAFTSAQTLTAHIRITGHYSKPGRISYDCQYCMKKLQSSINLLSHIKKSHLAEGERDGIVCLDELDSMDNLEGEGNEEAEEESQEYILPEMLPDNLRKDKVKIISNVKVPINQQGPDSTQQNNIVPLEASSETEALSNVATGIAASLNLVDIVVLDENQQYILQQDGQNEQEFIIPELAHGQPFTGQVITTQDNTVIQQGMIQSSTGDIASTDELVMVLTDHDYPDEQEGENPENSNIVVLYSHPVEGQEGQFITSQGNLMVNSQTGMLEIRNGSTISTTAASQMVVTNSVDSPIESIEMIQREIDSQRLKQKDYFKEGRISETNSEQKTVKLQSMPDIQDIAEPEIQESPLDTEGEHVTLVEEEQHKGVQQEVDTKLPPHIEETLNESTEQSLIEKDNSDDNVDGNVDVSAEEPMDIDDLEHKTAEAEESEENINQENPGEIKTEIIETASTEQPVEDNINNEEIEKSETLEGTDVPPDKSPEKSLNVILNNPSLVEELNPSAEHEKQVQKEPIYQDEPMEVDGKIVEEEESIEKEVEKEQHMEKNEIENRAAGVVHDSDGADEPDNHISQEEEEVSQEEELPKENPETEHEELQQNNSNPPQEIISQNIPVKNNTDINRTILDDWEDDTDSQQSEKNADSESQILSDDRINKESAVPTAVDNVTKLMDDWDEEDEDEKKD